MPSPTALSHAESVVLQRLPQHTGPLHNELLDSFLDRLSQRNGLHAKTLSNIIESSTNHRSGSSQRSPAYPPNPYGRRCPNSERQPP